MDINDENYHLLLQQILSFSDVKDLHKFVSGIFTPKEIEEFVRRLQIVKLIKQGVPHRQIADQLGVGIATVSRGSAEVKKGNFSVVE